MRYLLDNARARKLDQVAVGYTVGAWAVIQATSVGASAFAWPQWALQAIIIVGVVGLPVVLIGAWVWGVRRETGGALRPGRADLHVLGIISIFLVVAGALFVWAFWPRPPVAQIAAQPLSSAPPNSVAVLPFANTSGEPNQKYFSEGITDELIGLLARNSALRVAARTSSFFFEGKNEDVRTIAQKLNVRAVLEGSVRQAGDHIRIEADLIDASNGYQLWSQSYDRDLKDILGLQSEIASAIARALAPKILGKTAVPAPRAIDPAIYREYLRGQYLLEVRTGDYIPQAIAIFRKVSAAAPDFADGHGALAYALLFAKNKSSGASYDDEFQRSLTRALELDPTNPQTLTVAIEDAANRWDWDTLIQYTSILKHSGTHSAIGAHGMSYALDAFNLIRPALGWEKEWLRLDPLSITARRSIRELEFTDGRYEDVIASAEALNHIRPDDFDNDGLKCVSLASLGRVNEARTILTKLRAGGAAAKSPAFDCNFFVTLKSGRIEAARTLVTPAESGNYSDLGHDEASIGFFYAQLGDYAEATKWYAKAMDDHTFAFGFYLGAVVPAAFFASPEWQAFTKRPDFSAWAAARERARSILLDTK